ncbi:MAG: hypothetical protein IV100_12090 [Myxococcales bacterium]|nr:hypothetical protein [Myxococcales bacterium]
MKVLAEITLSGTADFPRRWDPWTGTFVTAQWKKCGYCECELQGGSPNVEHYAPKGNVTRLAEDGVEDPSTQRVNGRKEAPVHATGYWWHAYEWDNWLVACEKCNTRWKMNLFPVAEDPHPPPAPGTAYTPLLLNPYQGPDPEEHLEFDSAGGVVARSGSQRGTDTIRTCGLDRPSLVEARHSALVRCLADLDLISTGLLDESAIDRLMEPGRPYAAAVRCALWRRLRELATPSPS